MALIINTEKFHRFQKEGVQKSRNAVENDKNISQGIRIENSEVTAPWVYGGLKYDIKSV